MRRSGVFFFYHEPHEYIYKTRVSENIRVIGVLRG